LKKKSNEHLIIKWADSVGSCIESQGFNVEEQFKKLINDERVNYGFQY